MSTTSLPSYPIPLELGRIPSYHQEPRAEERRIAIALTQRCDGEGRSRTTEFAKLSRTRGMSLHLFNQAKGVAVPVYGMRAPIEGTLQLSKTDGLSLIAIKVEGILKLKEVAEGGTSTTVLCDETVFLWRKGVDLSPCPSRLNFSVAMPTLYTDGRNTYALPPTFEAHLTGLPGFTANIEYQITAIAARMKLPKIGLLTGVGQTTVSTPFLYYPRTCPSSPLPSPMRELDSVPGLIEVLEWRSYETNIAARSTSSKSVTCRFYVPRSHVFCVNESIPFHISFASSAVTLSALLFSLPATSHVSSKSSVRVQLLRQTCVDVKDEYQTIGTNTELWRIVNIGEGTLQRSVDGPRWLTLSGEIVISSDVKVGSFKASGLWVRDFIVFSLTPPDVLNGPIDDARIVIPIRLVTDRYSSDLQYSHVDPPGLEELQEHAHSLSTTS